MMKLHLSMSMVLALAFATGCPADPADDGDDTSNDSTATGAGTGADGMDDGMTSMADATVGDDGVDDGMTSAATDDTGTDTMPTDPLPDGSQCGSDEECISMNCFVAGVLGGICGECNEDADCEGGGCSLPNPITSAPSVCNMGELGGGCESDAVCMEPLLCALILDVPGILSASTCSECNTDTECTDGNLCSPIYDVANISGQKECIAPASVPDGGGCELDAGNSDGNAACESGFCATASFMRLLELGVCSGCLVNGDCDEGAGEVCNAPEIDLAMGLVPGACGTP